MGRGALELTHLLFADDFLLFTEVSIESTQIIIEMLQICEQCSGQHNQRSTILFAKLLASPQRTQILHLEMPYMEKMTGKYLGVPCFIGKSKKQIFGYIKDKITKKVQEWKEKFLS